jgi:hypothetical protein
MWVPASHMSDPRSKDQADPPPEDLPPLDGSEQDADDHDSGDILTELPDTFGGEDPTDLDDAVASDLDVGVRLEDDCSEGDAEVGELPLDFDDVMLVPDEASATDAETEAPVAQADLDGSADLEPVPERFAGDTEDGAIEDVRYLVSEELPGLDADEESSAGGDTWDLAAAGNDEPLPPWVEPRWCEAELPAEPSSRPSAAVVLEPDAVVAAGATLVRIDRDLRATTTLPDTPAQVSSLVALGARHETLVFSTRAGGLWRYPGPAGGLEALPDWRRAAGVTTAQPVTLDLCAVPGRPQCVLARTSGGRLLGSHDGGSRFELLELHGKILAVCAAGSRLLALSAGKHGTCLLESLDAGRCWSTIGLEGIAARIASGPAPLLVADADAVVLADAALGVAVSTSGGTAFQRVRGAVGPTALAVGHLDGRAVAWAALYREADDASDLCLIDVSSASALRIGTVRARDGSDESEGARVAALLWSAPQRRLWAAGDFGLRCFTPPDRDVTESISRGAPA